MELKLMATFKDIMALNSSFDSFQWINENRLNEPLRGILIAFYAINQSNKL